MRRATRKRYSAEEKIRIVLDGLRGEDSIVELCRREGIAQSLYYSWSKEFLEAGKKRLAGDTAREATSTEVKGLRKEAVVLKEVVAELTLEVEHWSLTTLREKLIKIGAKDVRHGRYVTFQLAEITTPRTLFAEILCLIDRLRPAPLPP
ncbi:MAG: transposase [Hyphomicrobiales bacterium]|nr:transposase [Hyphomicrobiales bacterium]